MASQLVSRRVVLQRLGLTGLAATLSTGLLELVRAGNASASVPVIPASLTQSVTPDACCVGTLAEGKCGGPCPSGYYCYEINGCGHPGYKYACIGCKGTQTCRYNC